MTSIGALSPTRIAAPQPWRSFSMQAAASFRIAREKGALMPTRPPGHPGRPEVSLRESRRHRLPSADGHGTNEAAASTGVGLEA